MKNRLRFIFPRLAGATLIVGAASLIMFTLFKLMVGLLLIGGVAMLIARAAGRHNPYHGSRNYGHFGNHGPGPLANRNNWSSPITVDANPLRKETIVPIN
jgi:hypothetical protein